MTRLALAAGGAVIVAAVAVLALRGKDGDQPPPTTPAKEPPASAPRVIESAAAVPQPSATPMAGVQPLPKDAANKHVVTYPGNVTMPGLNGITADVKMTWGQGPFTPIVGIVNGPGGWQWYLHENGAQSTVAMVAMNGTPQAMGFVAEPAPAVPQPPSQAQQSPNK